MSKIKLLIFFSIFNLISLNHIYGEDTDKKVNLPKLKRIDSNKDFKVQEDKEENNNEKNNNKKNLETKEKNDEIIKTKDNSEKDINETIMDGLNKSAPFTNNDKKLTTSVSTFSEEKKEVQNNLSKNTDNNIAKTENKEQLPINKKDKKELSPEEIAQKKEDKRIKSIWINSMLLPGLGQIQNGKIWKTGVIWLGFAGLGGGAVYFHNQYMEIDKLTKLPKKNVYDRAWRNGLCVAIFFWYVWNVLDAYVDAHMSTYDISKKLGPSKIPGTEKEISLKKKYKERKKRKKKLKKKSKKKRKKRKK